MNSDQLDILERCHLIVAPPVNFTVIMPFNRPHNADLINKSFASGCDGLRGKARLMAACHDSGHLPCIPGAQLVQLVHDWDFCYWKCNQILDRCFPVPSGIQYFGFTCDDDGYEPGFFADLERVAGNCMNKGKPPGIMIVSMRRWYHESKPRPEAELIAEPFNMQMGRIGLEQFYIRADIMERFRFCGQVQGRRFGGGDGELIIRLFNRMPKEFLFIPDLFTNWNNLPGNLPGQIAA
jgi:hypothetical protein